MSDEDYIKNTVKTGIESFLKGEIPETKDKTDDGADEKPKKKDDVEELPENEVPAIETPEAVEPEEAPEDGDLAKKYLGKDLKSASDEEIATLLTNTIAALGF